MRKLNPEHIAYIIDLINNGPYFKLLSIAVSEIDKGYCIADIDMHENYLNLFGAVHGGVYASIIDTVAYWAVYGETKENTGLISIDLQVNNLAPVKEGRLAAQGRSIKIGKTICLAQAELLDEENKLLAHGTSKILVSNRLQDIKRANHFMANNSKVPLKFISDA